MRLVIFRRTADDDAAPQLGLLTDGGGVVAVDVPSAPTAGAALKQVVADYDAHRARLAELATTGPAIPHEQVRLLPPLADPAKLLCALRMPMQHTDTEDALHVFLKAPGSALGDGGEVVLPQLEDAELFTHDACLAVVIGRRCHSVAASDWRDVVFGYTALVDITVRTGEQTRWKAGISALGSSCDTFGPLGPVVVPRAEVDEAAGFGVRLHCGDELRQEFRVDDFDRHVGAAIERATSIMTLQPGDVVAVGTTAGQGPVQDGDALQLEIDQVGRLAVSVRDPHGRSWDRSLRVDGPVGVR